MTEWLKTAKSVKLHSTNWRRSEMTIFKQAINHRQLHCRAPTSLQRKIWLYTTGRRGPFLKKKSQMSSLQYQVIIKHLEQTCSLQSSVFQSECHTEPQNSFIIAQEIQFPQIPCHISQPTIISCWVQLFKSMTKNLSSYCCLMLAC